MPKLPKKGITPLQAQLRNAFKNRIFEFVKGDKYKLARLLRDSAMYVQYGLVGKFIELAGGDAVRVMRRLGVTLSISGRQIRVRDALGSYEFTDDFYYSGIRYLLEPAEKLLCVDFELPVPVREPEALRKLGFTGTTKTAASVFLARHRKEGTYAGLRMVRLFGSDNFALRPLEMNSFEFMAKSVSVDVHTRMGKRVSRVDPVCFLRKKKSELTSVEMRLVLGQAVVESSRKIFEQAVHERLAREVKLRLRAESEERNLRFEGVLAYILSLECLENVTMVIGFLMRQRDFLNELMISLEGPRVAGE